MEPTRRYFWTKVWGTPDALAFNSHKTRDDALATLRSGDMVAYLTSDVTEVDPLMRGRVAGAVEISDPPEPVMVEEIRRPERNKPVYYLLDGQAG